MAKGNLGLERPSRRYLRALRPRFRIASPVPWPRSPDSSRTRSLTARSTRSCAPSRGSRARSATSSSATASRSPASRCSSSLQSAGGALELRTLRQRLGISKANASEVAATLVARGLVDRRRSLRDRRAVTLWLTPAGERTLHRAVPGSCRPGPRRVRAARRRREARAGPALPEARSAPPT